MTTGPRADGDNLGFTFVERASGEVEVFHCGRSAATLRGRDAAKFSAKVAGSSSAEAQQLMARLTGNYKRGNEHRAAKHPRNLG